MNRKRLHRALDRVLQAARSLVFGTSGDEETGFIKGGDGGEFNCGNCIHMRNAACFHPKVMKRYKKPDGFPVEANDCCKYQKRPGDR